MDWNVAGAILLPIRVFRHGPQHQPLGDPEVQHGTRQKSCRRRLGYAARARLNLTTFLRDDELHMPVPRPPFGIVGTACLVLRDGFALAAAHRLQALCRNPVLPQELRHRLCTILGQ